MITIKVHGGLGNQMFQYAFGRALALRRGEELRLDASSLYDITPRRFGRYRKYGLSLAFRTDPMFNWAARFERAVRIPYFSAGFNKYYPALGGRLGLWRYVQERTMRFDPAIWDVKGSVYFDGYWRSEKYFKDCTEDIKKDFTFRSELSGATGTLAKEIASRNAVCLHIRRGDNVWNPASQKTHVVAPLGYYDEAIGIVKKKAGKDIKIYVFSDDTPWCQKELRLDADWRVVGDEHAGVEARDHLQLMSLCKHFIIPESTFSWWGAWLSTNKDKIVISPDVMFKDKSIPTEDMIPEGWLRI